MYYSNTTGFFYAADLRADYEAAGSWPDDAREVSAEEEAALRTPPTPTFAELSAQYLASVRATREIILNRIAGVGMAALVSADMATAAAVTTARTALLNITTDAAVLAATDLDGLEAAVLAIYKAIVAAAPAGLVKAFDGVDA